MSINTLDWGMIQGGFGLFLFGIKFMGKGLKDTAGDKLRDFINKYTSNPISAMLIGILVTIIMQSSSATSAMTIGFVRAGLMTLEQAVGIILGATIGTTATSFLISISIEKYALFIVFAGAMLICFAKKQQLVNIGNVILGFGLIFYGMSGMGDALAALKEMPRFEALAVRMSEQPIMAMLIGIVLTAIVQSSAATIGVAQKLYRAGALTFSASLPFMFGANIGTTMTGILASAGGSTEGKRTAVIHTTLNSIAAVFGMLLLKPYSNIIQHFFGNMNPMMQIAVANIVFKLITTPMFLPFRGTLVKTSEKIVPGKKVKDDESELGLDRSLGGLLPSAAVQVAKGAILNMVGLVGENISEANRFLVEGGGKEQLEKMVRTETRINRYDREITDYLSALSIQPHMTSRDIVDIRSLFDAVKNYERVGDLAENLWEFFDMVKKENEVFTSQAISDMSEMFSKLKEMFNLSVKLFLDPDESGYEELKKLEDSLDQLELKARMTHFERMGRGICTSPVAESIYCDILGTLERMGDHCCNVGRSVTSKTTSDISDDEVVEVQAVRNA